MTNKLVLVYKETLVIKQPKQFTCDGSEATVFLILFRLTDAHDVYMLG